MLEKGRICLKITGREAGKYCVVVEPQDASFVLVTGPKTVTRVRRRKVNVLHIEPTEHVLEIASGSDADIENAWKSSGLIEKLNIEIPRLRAPKEDKKSQ